MSAETKPNLGEDITDATDDLKEYMNLRIQLMQVNIIEKVSIALSNIISTGTTVVFLILFFIFGSFALSYWLGNLFESTAAGFGILAGFYLLIAIILLLGAGHSMRRKLVNLFITEFTNDDAHGTNKS